MSPRVKDSSLRHGCFTHNEKSNSPPLGIYKYFSCQVLALQDTILPLRTCIATHINELRARKYFPPCTAPPSPRHQNGPWRLRYHGGVQRTVLCRAGGHRGPSPAAGGRRSMPFSQSSGLHYQELTETQREAEILQVEEDERKLIRAKKSRGIMVCFQVRFIVKVTDMWIYRPLNVLPKSRTMSPWRTTRPSERVETTALQCNEGLWQYQDKRVLLIERDDVPPQWHMNRNATRFFPSRILAPSSPSLHHTNKAFQVIMTLYHLCMYAYMRMCVCVYVQVCAVGVSIYTKKHPHPPSPSRPSLLRTTTLLQKLTNNIRKILDHVSIPQSLRFRLSIKLSLFTPKTLLKSPRRALTADILSFVALRNLVAIFSLPSLLGCSPSSVSATGS
jgi:hypothetical protein